jgi:hypothetical protein
MIGFVLAVTTAARARAWQIFAVAVALLAYTTLFAFAIVLFSGRQWAPF